LNGRDIPFENNVKYLGVIFGKKITWKLHIETIEAKAFRTIILSWPFTKLSLGLQWLMPVPPENLWLKPICWNCSECKIGFSQRHWQFSKTHIDSRYVCSFPNSVRLWLHNKTVQKTSRNHS
jgi:hypothetical protein